MKKRKSSSPVTEECGVWLDTAEMKKKKQPNLTRPIYKALNPFAGGGYNINLSLSFTQTKHPLPVTKQTTISSFFAPRRTDDKNSMASDAGPDRPGFPSALWSESKAREEKWKLCLDEPQEYHHCSAFADSVGLKEDPNSSVPQVTEFDTSRHEDDKHGHYEYSRRNENNCSLARDCAPDMTSLAFLSDGESQSDSLEPLQDPLDKGSLGSVDCTMSEVSRASEHHKSVNPGKYDFQAECAERSEIWSGAIEEALTWQHAFTQDSQGNRVIARCEAPQPPTKKRPQGSDESHDWLNGEAASLNSETFCRKLLTREGCTSTQKRPDSYSVAPKMSQPEFQVSWEESLALDKENICSSSCFGSPKRQNTTRGRSPLKDRLFSSAGMNGDLEKELVSSPKRARMAKSQFSTQAMLFTQDSQGNRVIAHRGCPRRMGRSPLKDRTSWTQRGWESPAKISRPWLREDSRSSLDSDSEAELLFTQDSEGNMVIKH
nr:PREDICTED: aurora kinase A and ninein-interacting protein [Lepisosteus oculatus]XP_015213225.1 PREDICTED: aurora kinase A and ninein-interacting protein [Lepisosteus oculatus]